MKSKWLEADIKRTLAAAAVLNNGCSQGPANASTEQIQEQGGSYINHRPCSEVTVTNYMLGLENTAYCQDFFGSAHVTLPLSPSSLHARSMV